MKVVHICMIAYIDGWGYQENILPNYMAKAGHEVTIIASSSHFPSFLKKKDKEAIVRKGDDYYLGDIHIYRIKTKLNTSSYTFYCKGLYKILKKEKPDAIFHHGINSSSMLVCDFYVKTHKGVKFFVDNHSDMINQSKHTIWNYIVLRGLMHFCVKLVQKDVKRFYGVSPGRCEYLKEVFGAPTDKVSLLPLGCDIDAFDNIKEGIESLRSKHGIPISSFIIISGGKMGVDKGTHTLIEAVEKIRVNHPDVILLLFGTFSDQETAQMIKNKPWIKCFGWCNRQTTIELLKMSNLACWPIHHTTLIEDAITVPIPIVVRKTSNTMHLVDGNGFLVQVGKCDELYHSIDTIKRDYAMYMRASSLMRSKLSYRTIVMQFESDCYV